MNSLILPGLILASNTSDGNMEDTANAIVSISQAISEYGPLIVIMAVFVLIFVLMVVLLLKNNAKMINRLVEDRSNSENANQEMIKQFVEMALQNHKSDSDSQAQQMMDDIKKSIEESMKHNQVQQTAHNGSVQEEHGDDYHNDIVGAYIDVNMAFKDVSRKTLAIINCSRIGIYVFHNGNKSVFGLPFFKMSCIHEWTSNGRKTLRGKSHMDLPLHVFNDFIEDLWRDGVYKSQDISKIIEKDNSIEDFVEYSHTKSIYFVAIKDADDAMAGFVVAEFEDVDNFEENAARDNFIRENLNHMVLTVSPFVANKYIFKRNQHDTNNG